MYIYIYISGVYLHPGVFLRRVLMDSHAYDESTSHLDRGTQRAVWRFALGMGEQFRSQLSVCPAVVGLVIDLKGHKRLGAHRH